MPPFESTNDVKRKLRDFARQACKGKTSIHVSWKEVAALVDALTEAILEMKPGTTPSQALDDIRAALKLRCEVCGFWDPELLNVLYLADSIGGFIGGGPLSQLATTGACPRCRSSGAKATFSPAKIGLHKNKVN